MSRSSAVKVNISSIKNLFNKFAIDSFDIVAGAEEVQGDYTGFFGDSVEEIYDKIIQNTVETKVFVHDPESHQYGFADNEDSEKVFRYFLSTDALEYRGDYVLN